MNPWYLQETKKNSCFFINKVKYILKKTRLEKKNKDEHLHVYNVVITVQ